MVIVVGESAQDKFNRIRENQKFELYEKMLARQDKIIEDAMVYGRRECAFHFAFERERMDTFDRYNAQEWFDEFLKCATKQYEANGYTISGTTIKW